jgi:MoxR-like ATPase
MLHAVNAALLIRRPLLLWGEPGIGKSQLARAAAIQLQRAFVHFVVDARTESQDLLYRFDAVARLAEAQIQCRPSVGQGDGRCAGERSASAGHPDRSGRPAHTKDDPLAMERFIIPGCMWWALNWESACAQASRCGQSEPGPIDARCDPKNGVVLLIDEIDKADSDVPNGLLEALGAGRFHPVGLDSAVEASPDCHPLVCITTNEERTLPDAFMRRCLSLHLSFPQEREAQKDFLIQRAMPNFSSLDSSLIERAAEMLVTDRAEATKTNRYPLPGQAEFFDLLRGLQGLQDQGRDPSTFLERLRTFTFRKHPGFHRKDRGQEP